MADRDRFGFEVHGEIAQLHAQFLPLSERDEHERKLLWNRFLMPQADAASMDFASLSLDEVAEALAGTSGGATPDPRQWEAVHAMVRQGVPNHMRAKLWPIFLRVQERREPGQYEKLHASSSGAVQAHDADDALPSPDMPSSRERKLQQFKHTVSQIEKDLPRTFPNHPALNSDGREALGRVLTAYARHNPSVGYCQGMNFVAAMLLLQLSDEEHAFWCLCALVEDVLPGYYSHAMVAAEVDQLMLQELVEQHMPQVARQLEGTGAPCSCVASSWFLTLFVTALPTESALRVWDVLLYERQRTVLFRVALGLMEMHTPELLAAREDGEVIELLQRLAPQTFDGNRLVAAAYGAFGRDITPASLQELHDKHRPKVVLRIANDSMRYDDVNVWKEPQTYTTYVMSPKRSGAATAEDTPSTSNSWMQPSPLTLDTVAKLRRPPGASRFTPCTTDDERRARATGSSVRAALDFDAVATTARESDDVRAATTLAATDDEERRAHAAVEQVLEQVAKFGRSVSLSLSVCSVASDEEDYDSPTSLGTPACTPGVQRQRPELLALQERCRQLDQEIAAAKSLLLAKTQHPPSHEHQNATIQGAQAESILGEGEGMPRQVEAARQQHEEKALALSRLEAALEEVNQSQRAVESLAAMEEMNRLARVGPRLTRSTTR